MMKHEGIYFADEREKVTPNAISREAVRALLAVVAEDDDQELSQRATKVLSKLDAEEGENAAQ